MSNKITSDDWMSFWSNRSRENNFYIYWDIDESFPKDIIVPFIEEMKIQKQRRDSIINIYINSHWGIVSFARELISLIEQCKSNYILVKTIVIDSAASAASLIAITGHVRIVWKNASHIIHNPRWYNFAATEKQIDNETAVYKELLKRSSDHYKKYTKIKDVENKLNEENHSIRWSKNLIKDWFADIALEESVI